MDQIKDILFRYFNGKEALTDRKKLRACGLSGKLYSRWLGKVLIYLVVLVIAAVVICKSLPIGFKDIASSFVSLGIAIVVYQQWLASRHEISIDKYYDRLENVNKRLEAYDHVEKKILHVYSELDKLEYVLLKYELGYISPQLTLRALNNFKGLCRDLESFRERAYISVNKAAYLKQTVKLVNLACEEYKQQDHTSIATSDIVPDGA